MRVKRKIALIFKILLISILGISFLFYQPKQVQALEWYENLIDDDMVFINKDAMSLQQIQDFLVVNGSYLANYRMTWGGVDRSGAEWIYDEAQEHGINPQVLIVTLQKEQGLITSSAPSGTALDCAMGYGASPTCSYMFTNKPQYRGFGAQIHYAAASFKGWFDVLGSGSCLDAAGGCRKVGDTISIPWNNQPGYASVYLSNRATIVLYRYTPYIYNGNYNFYNLFHNWFGSGVPFYYLKKASGGDGKVYLEINSKKYWIENMDTFTNWGFNWSNVQDIASEILANISEGNTIKRVVQDSSGKNYYIASGWKRFILNQAAALRFSIDTGSSSSLPDEVLNLLPNGDVLASLVKSAGDEVYLLDNIGKHHVINLKAFDFWNLSWGDIAFISDVDLSAITTSFDVSYVMRGSGQAVYFIDQGKKLLIRDPFAFNELGFSWEDISVASDDWINAIPSGNSLWILAKTASNPTVYLIDSGIKHSIPDLFIFQFWGFHWEDVAVFSDNAINQMSTGANVTFLIKGSGPEVNFMDNGYKHATPNLDIFGKWGFHWADVRNYSDNLVNTVYTGPNLTGLVKGSGPAVYLMNNGYKCLIPNPNVFSKRGLNWGEVRQYTDLLINAIYSGPSLN